MGIELYAFGNVVFLCCLMRVWCLSEFKVFFFVKCFLDDVE